MAALTSGSWTITFPNDRSMDTVIKGKKKYIDLKLKLASGEVPAAGVNMPKAGSVGLVRNLDKYILPALDPIRFGTTTATGDSVIWILNTTGNKLKPYNVRFASGTGRAIAALATGVTIKSHTFFVTAVGW